MRLNLYNEEDHLLSLTLEIKEKCWKFRQDQTQRVELGALNKHLLSAGGGVGSLSHCDSGENLAHHWRIPLAKAWMSLKDLYLDALNTLQGTYPKGPVRYTKMSRMRTATLVIIVRHLKKYYLKLDQSFCK